MKYALVLLATGTALCALNADGTLDLSSIAPIDGAKKPALKTAWLARRIRNDRKVVPANVVGRVKLPPDARFAVSK